MQILIISAYTLLSFVWLSLLWVAAMAACCYIIGFVIGVCMECYALGVREALANSVKTTVMLAHNMGKSITCNMFGVRKSVHQHKATRYSWS